MTDTPQLQNVLLIDDDDFIQDIYTTKFTEEGIDVTTAQDGSAAIEKLRESDFDAILADIIMPNTDGLEFLKQLRAENLAGDASVIILSNQGQPEDIDNAEQFDIDGYIIKASKVPSEVLDKIKEIHTQSHA